MSFFSCLENPYKKFLKNIPKQVTSEKQRIMYCCRAGFNYRLRHLFIVPKKSYFNFDSKVPLSNSSKGTQDEKTPPSGLSDLARIDLTSGSPYDLFTEWHEEARKFSSGLPNAFCLATVSK